MDTRPAPPALPSSPAAARDCGKVHVSGYPPYTQAQDLTHVFGQFGTVRVERLTSKFACLTFGSRAAAGAAVGASRRLVVYGEFLTVRPYTRQLMEKQLPLKREFPMSKQKCVIVEPSEIDLTGDFHQQLDRILAAVRLTQEEATAISLLYEDLEQVLQPLWPGCKAYPFGSITTGLGIKTSDADCFVYIPPAYQNANANYVNKAKRVLMTHPQKFAEVLSIPRANTPIVKFFHTPTGTNCDLSFKTPLGARNSELIAFLLRYDARLIPMAVMIKYWAKVQGISGTGKLTNYALTMMIIFYLQQAPMSILPSVQWLQRDSSRDLIVDGWNTGFIDNKDLLPASSNTSSISELLGGFFEYYSTFNFEESLVCPYLGVPVKKVTFQDLNLLPNDFERYKQNVLEEYVYPLRFNTPMCVQDPFEQCHNVASPISSKLAADIKAFFKHASEAYEAKKLNKCDGFLKTILLEKPKLVKSRKSLPEFRANLFPRIVTNILQPEWKPVVRDVVFTIFEKMLKFTLGKLEEKVNPESKKEKEKYISMLTKAIWKRKQFSKFYFTSGNMDFETKQAKITEEIFNADKTTYNVQFQLTLTFVQEPKSAVIAVKLLKGDIEPFREFGRFFQSVMQNWSITLLKPHTKPCSLDAAAKIAETIRLLDKNLDDNNEDDDSEEETVANGTDDANCDVVPAVAESRGNTVQNSA